MLDPEDVFVPSAKIAYREVEGQVVLVSAEDNSVVTLNPSGSRAWMALDGRTVAQVASAVEESFEVTDEQAIEDVSEFLTYLFERGWLKKASR